MKEKTELEKFLDRSLFLELRKIKRGVHNDPHNCMIKAKTGDDVLAFVKYWAEKNDVHLFVLDWDKLDPAYINDYENGLLKDLSTPKTVMYLENYTGIEFEKRYLVSSVYKDRKAGCTPVPNFLFAIATSYTDLPKEQFHRLDGSEKSCFATIDFLMNEERERKGDQIDQIQKKETFDMEMEEIYERKVSGTYPYNLLESIFGREAENTEDAQKSAELEKTLSEIIELRLTNEEKTVLFKVYRDGKSLAEIAEEQSADPYETYIHMAASLRKLRHPSSSKLLKGFLQEEQ